MRLVWRLMRFATPYRWWALGGICLSVIVMLANIALMGLSGWFITAMALAGVAGVSMNYFTPAAIIRGLAILRTGGRYGERLVTHEATFRVMMHLRRWCFERLEPLAPSRLQGLHSGQLFTALRDDTECLEKAYLRVFLPIIAGSITALLLLLFFYQYHPAFAAAMLLLLVLAGAVVPLLSLRWGAPYSQAIIAQKTQLTEHSIDYLQGMAELQLYDAEARFIARIEANSEHLAQVQIQAHGLDAFADGMVQSAARIALWLMIVLAIPLLQEATLPPANLTMLALLAMASFEAIAPIPAALRLWQEVKSSAQHLFTLADTDREVVSQAQPSLLLEHPVIQLQEVTLRYPERERDALSQLSLTIPFGEHLAITGAAGSGKSSVAALISGLWAPQSGQVLLGDLPLPQLDETALHHAVCLAEQNPYLFADTIAANLRVAKPDASQEALEQVCRIAQIHDFITAQPSGYDTYVGEHGMALSGGQRRRLGIARALLRDAPILILDEPGEGLDIPTEIAMLSQVVRHQQGRTLILITHKTAGLKQMARVLQIEQGVLHEVEHASA